MEESAGLRAVTYARSWETAPCAGETEGVQRCSPQKARPGKAASEVGEAKAEELGRASRTTGSVASEACVPAGSISCGPFLATCCHRGPKPPAVTCLLEVTFRSRRPSPRSLSAPTYHPSARPAAESPSFKDAWLPGTGWVCSWSLLHGSLRSGRETWAGHCQM